MNKRYKVYLIGAGPGKPDLITVRGLEILRQAEVVIYDYLVDKKILEETKPTAELICCDKLAKKGQWSDGFIIHQERIHNLLVKKAKEGKRVARLKNGDPSIFSRTSQELDALVKSGIDFEIVPGVTAANAAAGYSGIPLTDRRYASSCVFVTGHEDPKKKTSAVDWDALAENSTIVLYMGVENLENIVAWLVEAGRDKSTPCAIVQNATLLTQKAATGTLADIATKAKNQKISAPAIIIIGDVVRLQKDFNWLKKTRKILFTGLSRERFFTKETYFHLPVIKIVPMENYTEFDNWLKRIDGFDWLIFSSRYGVEYFFKRLIHIGRDWRALNNAKIAAIGNSTKSYLLNFGILADLVPKKESSQGLVEEFAKIDIKDKKIFMPRSDISDKGLGEGLKKLGARVTTSFAYRNVMPKDLPDLNWDNFDEIMFTSPSTVRNFRKRYKKLPKGVKISCIGEATKTELELILPLPVGERVGVRGNKKRILFPSP